MVEMFEMFEMFVSQNDQKISLKFHWLRYPQIVVLFGVPQNRFVPKKVPLNRFTHSEITPFSHFWIWVPQNRLCHFQGTPESERPSWRLADSPADRAGGRGHKTG